MIFTAVPLFARAANDIPISARPIRYIHLREFRPFSGETCSPRNYRIATAVPPHVFTGPSSSSQTLLPAGMPRSLFRRMARMSGIDIATPLSSPFRPMTDSGATPKISTWSATFLPPRAA